MTFFGKSRVEHEVEHHIHESPSTMTVPLMILAVLSVVGGFVGVPHASLFEHWMEPVVEPVKGAAAAPAGQLGMELGLMALSLAVAGAGIWLAYRVYLEREGMADQLAARWKGLYELVDHKYYMDEIYDALFVNRTKDLATSLGVFDRGVVDGVGVDGSAWLTRFTSSASMWWDKWIVDGVVNLAGNTVRLLSYPVRFLQTGLVQSYALFIVLGVLALLGSYLYALLHTA